VNIQKSFIKQGEATAGSLYLVATPIGNLEDMTFRAVNVLREVQWIAAEDTRQTRKLLSHFGISTRMVSYHEHNKHASGRELIRILKTGDSIALVSDAGLPGISDPGYELVVQAIEEQIPVIPVPGANAALSALIVSGLPSSKFTFIGFLPRDKKNALKALEEVRGETGTILCYESPHRLEKTLKLMLEILGDRSIALARELTKKYEELWRGKISECLDKLQDYPPQGEYCIVIEGGGITGEKDDEKQWWSDLTVEDHVGHYVHQGEDIKDAIKKTAADRGVAKREVYNEVMRK
jgi:16S rRNA (cytidine1402-2'-O)-methyltransferase